MTTMELLVELAEDPYARTDYLRKRACLPDRENAPSMTEVTRHSMALEGTWEACVGCCDPGADEMPDDPTDTPAPSVTGSGA